MSLDARGLSPFRIAIAAVLGVFTFLAAVLPVSERFGGWPGGYLVSGVLAVVVFGVALLVVMLYFSGSAGAKSGERPRTPGPTTIVQTPVNVNVPVNVRVGENRETATEDAPRREKEVSKPRQKTPRPRPEPPVDPIVLLAGNARNVCSRGPHDVEPGKPTKIPLEVREGIPLTGTLEEEDGDDFEWMIVDEDNYVKYRQGERFAALASGRDKGAYKVWVVIPRRGPWFLVLEAYGKQLIREVWAELRLGS